jgi:uncharacterized phosphatase
MKRLYFIRHGQSVMNQAGLWSGQSETPLTHEGQKEARQAAQFAKDLQINHIVSSPFSRAHDTARIIAMEIGYPQDTIELNDLLIERGLGAMEGHPWQSDVDFDKVEGAETLEELFERVRIAYDLITGLPADNILIVSHGATGRALRNIIYPNIDFHQPPSFMNAQIIQLV